MHSDARSPLARIDPSGNAAERLDAADDALVGRLVTLWVGWYGIGALSNALRTGTNAAVTAHGFQL